MISKWLRDTHIWKNTPRDMQSSMKSWEIPRIGDLITHAQHPANVL